MDYFRLKHSTDLKIIGNTFPQSQDFSSDINIHDPRFIWNNSVPFRSDVYIPNPILHPKAIYTDLMSSASLKYPLVSLKLFRCIERFNYHTVEFYKVSVIEKNVKNDAFVILSKTKGFDFLDFNKTEIDLLERFKFSERLHITSSDQLENEVEKTQYPFTIAISKYSFKKLSGHDIFYVANIPGGGGYFVSDRLKQEMMISGCTGIEFEPI